MKIAWDNFQVGKENRILDIVSMFRDNYTKNRKSFQIKKQLFPSPTF